MLRDVAALTPFERDAGLGHLAAVQEYFPALFVVERREEFVEIAIAGIRPVELHGVAQHHALRVHAPRFRRKWKEDVQ